jgi:plasmid stability protein
MATFLLRDLPAELHRRLKEEAVRNHRSMSQQVVAILERHLADAQPQSYPPPVRVAFPMTDEFLNKTKRRGRA